MGLIVKAFLSLRAFMLIASVGALAGSLVMYWIGAKYMLEAAGIVHPEVTTGVHVPVVLVLEAMDAFLFAVVLTIFAYGIAVGFVFHLSPEVLEPLPDWMKVSGIGELKHHTCRSRAHHPDRGHSRNRSWPPIRRWSGRS